MMKGLIENECGGQNPLMKLTAHFGGPAANSQILSQQEAIRSMQQQQSSMPREHQLVSEYLAIESEKSGRASIGSGGDQFVRRLPAPRSFQMEALFNELKQIDSMNAAVKSTSISTSALNTNSNSKTTTTTALHPNASQTESLNGLSRSVSPAKTPSAIRSISHVNNLAQEWSQDYWMSLSAAFKKQQQQQAPLIIDDRTFKWSTDYLTQTEATIFDEA